MDFSARIGVHWDRSCIAILRGNMPPISVTAGGRNPQAIEIRSNSTAEPVVLNSIIDRRSELRLGGVFSGCELCLHPALANRLGLVPDLQVDVRFVPSESIPVAVDVFVEPISPDDYDVIMCNALALEGQLLNQIQVVQVGVQYPVWVDGSVCVFIRIESARATSTEQTTNLCRMTSTTRMHVQFPGRRASDFQDRKVPNGAESDCHSVPAQGVDCVDGRLGTGLRLYADTSMRSAVYNMFSNVPKQSGHTSLKLRAISTPHPHIVSYLENPNCLCLQTCAFASVSEDLWDRYFGGDTSCIPFKIVFVTIESKSKGGEKGMQNNGKGTVGVVSEDGGGAVLIKKSILPLVLFNTTLESGSGASMAHCLQSRKKLLLSLRNLHLATVEHVILPQNFMNRHKIDMFQWVDLALVKNVDQGGYEIVFDGEIGLKAGFNQKLEHLVMDESDKLLMLESSLRHGFLCNLPLVLIQNDTAVFDFIDVKLDNCQLTDLISLTSDDPERKEETEKTSTKTLRVFMPKMTPNRLLTKYDGDLQVSNENKEINDITARLPLPKSLQSVAVSIVHEMDKGHSVHLITGPMGSGKSAILTALQSLLVDSKLVHCHVVNCRQLRGKKPDTISKLLQSAVQLSLSHAPAVLLLDDFDEIAGKGANSHVDGGGEGALFAQRRAAELIRRALDTDNTSAVHIVMSAPSRHKLHEIFVSCKGRRFVQKFHQIPTLDEETRRHLFLRALQTNLSCVDFEQQSTLTEKIALATDGFMLGDMCRLNSRCAVEITAGATYDQIICTITSILDTFTPLHQTTVNKLQPTENLSGFKSVGGLKWAKDLLTRTFLWPLKYGQLYKSGGLPLASGALLYGPSGSGKTLLARALALESGANFIGVKGAELLSKYIGQSEENVRELFQRARRTSPCIILLDECDAMAPRRGHDSTGVTDRVLNQLLAELDGVESNGDTSGGQGNRVFVLAATNRPELLDPALLRPGRLDVRIKLDRPDVNDRLEILQIICERLPINNFVDTSFLHGVAENTGDLTGADLKAVLTDANLLSVRRILDFSESVNYGGSSVVKQPEISPDDILTALQNYKRGLAENLNSRQHYLGNDVGKMVTRLQRVTLA